MVLVLVVLRVLVLVVLPSLYFGRRVRRLSRASQDRVADSSAIAAEVLNAIPIVQSYTQEPRESARFAESTEHAFEVARKRTRVRVGPLKTRAEADAVAARVKTAGLQAAVLAL